MTQNNKYIALIEQIVINAEIDRFNSDLYHLKISSELISVFSEQIKYHQENISNGYELPPNPNDLTGNGVPRPRTGEFIYEGGIQPTNPWPR